MNKFRSHTHFLRQSEFTSNSRLDAVIVPTRLDRPFASDIVERLNELNAPVFIIPPLSECSEFELPDNWKCLAVPLSFLVDFNSLSHVQMLPENTQAISWQLPVKRTYALHWARAQGFASVLLMDDDILIDVGQIHEAIPLLETHHCVSFPSTHFPDKSTIGHIAMSVGLDSQVFLSGAALLVRCSKLVGLFPQIYNEDWFVFLLEGLENVACGGTSIQLPYNPYTTSRSSNQELGDLLAETLLNYADRNQEWCSSTFWKQAIDQRVRYLEMLLFELSKVSGNSERRACIGVAKGVLSRIHPQWCAEFISRVQMDYLGWHSKDFKKG
jgi:hypothetical protein